MTELEKVALLVEIFEWPNEREWRFQALRLLRQAMGLPYPLPDDFERR